MKIDLNSALEKSGVSAAELGRRIGRSRSFISNIGKGKRNPSLPTLQAISDALGVPLGDLIVEGFDFDDAPISGFAESDVAPLVQPASSARIQHLIALMRDLKHPVAYKAKRAQPFLSILDGDVLAVDLNRKPASGDIVIATISDVETDEHLTVVRRWCAPWLTDSDPGTPPVKLEPDSQSVAIVGVVCGLLRGLGF